MQRSAGDTSAVFWVFPFHTFSLLYNGIVTAEVDVSVYPFSYVCLGRPLRQKVPGEQLAVATKARNLDL